MDDLKKVAMGWMGHFVDEGTLHSQQEEMQGRESRGVGVLVNVQEKEILGKMDRPQDWDEVGMAKEVGGVDLEE